MVRTERTTVALSGPRLRAWVSLVGSVLFGALIIVLCYQVPATHIVDIGGYDAAYTQGWYEPEVATSAAPPPYLVGSNGQARWSRARSVLLFPQAGLPGDVTLRLRGWRTDQPPLRVSLWLNGRTPLAEFQTTGAWQEQRVAIQGGVLKASDFFVEVRSDTTELADGREVGVLLDQVIYRVAPGGLITPYPSQVVYGGLAAALLWLLVQRIGNREQGTGRHGDTEQSGQEHERLRTLSMSKGHRSRKAVADPWRLALLVAAGTTLIALAWLLLYRLQPFYPYPLRWLLPSVDLGLLGLVTLRYAPPLAARVPILATWILSLGGVLVWVIAVLMAAQRHLILSRPGVENDFRVFATRDTLEGVFRADGFYNLGYPLLLWLVRPLTDGNAFIAARLVAALSGAVLLLASYWLARRLLPPGGALVALLVLALSPLVVEYGLYVGSDMPFAACVALALALLANSGNSEQGTRPATQHAPLSTQHLSILGLAGGAAGGAFLMRHLGLVLLPWGLAFVALGSWWAREQAYPEHVEGVQVRNRQQRNTMHWQRAALLQCAAFALGFLVVAAPQLWVNTAATGQPLYNQQAKNVWLAVYGNTDWSRWYEAPNDITLAEVVLRDPARFVANWWGNVVGYVGSGAEDTSEFGRAIQLRLLGWPANWLAVVGLIGWIAAVVGAVRASARQRVAWLGLLVLVGGYVLAVSTAFTLQRFFLPLTPIYALAVGWLVATLVRRRRVLLGVALVLGVVLWSGFGTGTSYVLDNQPADEVAVIQSALALLPPDATIVAQVSDRVPVAKYSALAHRVVPISAPSAEAIAASGAAFVLWDDTQGVLPLDANAATLVDQHGRYALYQLAAP